MKEYESEDGMKVWLCGNCSVGFGIGYESAELSAKDVGRLIIYLTKLLVKGIVK